MTRNHWSWEFNGIRRFSGEIVAIRPDWSIWTLLVPLPWRIRWSQSKIKLKKTQSQMMKPCMSTRDHQRKSQKLIINVFDPNFPDQDALKSIVRRHGQILLQPFNQEVLRVESLHLEVDPLTQFMMQPCRFIRSDILGPLKAQIDQFVSEGVLVSDISCTHTMVLPLS